MDAQGAIDESRLTHLRELKWAIGKLKTENAVLRDENAELRAHFDFALLAARDLEALPEDAKFVIVDGWNMILGAKKEARDRKELEAQAKAHLEAHPEDFVWIVLDGPRFASRTEGRLRVSYTGGAGAHRADRFICDFLRMAVFRGVHRKIEVRTNDKDFQKDVKRILSA